MKFLRTMAIAAILTIGAAPMAQAATAFVRTVDSFDFLVDYSGSMMMKSTTLGINKIDVVKDVLTKVNHAIPDLGYQGSLHTFAPATSIQRLAMWNPSTMDKSISMLQNDLAVFGRLTPIGDGLAGLAPTYATMPRPTAVIMVSDGANNMGIDPVAEASAIYQSQPGLCFHIISVADTEAGQNVLDNIAALNNCTVMVNAADMLDSQAVVDKFVADVFYQPIMEEVILLRGVNFAFDRYNIDATAQGILNEVAAILRSQPNTPITLEGWTDWIGTVEYNMALSQRRANAVRDYLVKQGVTNPMNAVGMGKSFKFDNNTADGRHLNRRTEIIFNN